MKLNFKIAILGFGSIGRRHVANLRAAGESDLVVFDPVAAQDEEPLVRSLEEVWRARPEVAFVCAPTGQHLPLALEAARQGCHLFIEKPLSHLSEGLDELEREVEARSLVTMVGCNMRFHFGHAQIHRWLEQGIVGEVLSARLQCSSFLPRWRPASDYRQSYSAAREEGGAVLDCIHELDLALWHLGAARLVAAQTLSARSIGLETDGIGELLLRHQSGAISSVHLDFVGRETRRGIEVIGEKGNLRWEIGERRALWMGEDGALKEAIEEPEGYDLNRMYQLEIAAFLDAVRQGTLAPNGIGEARRTLEIALEARGWKSQ